VERQSNNRSRQENQAVTFQVEVRCSSSVQREVGNKLFQRLLARTSKIQGDTGEEGIVGSKGQDRSARVDGGSRHPLRGNDE
jgi:hypothetical protein